MSSSLGSGPGATDNVVSNLSEEPALGHRQFKVVFLGHEVRIGVSFLVPEEKCESTAITV